MATERIQIVITETGSTRVVVNITNIARASDRATRSSNLLRNALFGIGAASVIRSLIRTADTVTNVGNRLRLVTEDTENLNTVFDELLTVSNQTRTLFSTNAELFTRTALATRELGLSQREVIDFTKSLAQAQILSGASAQEANNAIIQLTQGLQRGQLRGDEFRSVGEQLPIVLDLISDSLGVTRGELLKFAEQGKITPEVIVNAFSGAGSRLEAEFGNTIPTIGQAFSVLQNAVVGIVSDFERQNSATRQVAEAIIFLADNIDYIARVVISVGFVGALILAKNALVGLTAAAIANPFTAILVGLTAVISLLVAFQDEIKITEDGLVSLGDFFKATFQIISEIAGPTLDAFLGFVGPALEALGLVADGASITFFDILRVAAEFGDRFVGVFVGAASAISAIFEEGTSLPKTFARLGILLVNGLIEALEFATDVIRAFFLALGEAASASATRLSLGFTNIAEAARQAFAGNFDAAEQFAAEGLFQIKQAASTAGTAFVTDFESELDALRDVDLLARLEGPAVEDAQSFGQRVAGAFLNGFNSTTGLQNLVGAIETRTNLLAEQRKAEQDLAEINRQKQRERLDSIVGGGARDGGKRATSVLDGFEAGFDKLEDKILDFAAASEAALVNAFTSAEDALVEFVQTGEFNFSKLIDSILADLTRLLARQALFGLLAGTGTGGFSFDQTGGLGGFLFGGARADGGPVTAGTSYLVGEEGRPELFTPNSSGTITPMDEIGGGSTNITIVNVTDPSEIASFMASAQGEEIILNTIQRNPERVSQATSSSR